MFFLSFIINKPFLFLAKMMNLLFRMSACLVLLSHWYNYICYFFSVLGFISVCVFSLTVIPVCIFFMVFILSFLINYNNSFTFSLFLLLLQQFLLSFSCSNFRFYYDHLLKNFMLFLNLFYYFLFAIKNFWGFKRKSPPSFLG